MSARKIYWRRADRSVPDDDLTVLICLSDGEVWTGFREAGQWRYVSADPIGSPVTHWAEFPAPPQKAKSPRPRASAVHAP